MATNLKRMKIKEISGVDRPCSPGADVILMKNAPEPVTPGFAKRDVSNEPRDDHGRWSTGAKVAAGAAGAAAAGAALYFGGPALARHARGAAAGLMFSHAVQPTAASRAFSGAVNAASAAGKAVASGAKAAPGLVASAAKNPAKTVAGLGATATAVGQIARGLGLKSATQIRGGTRFTLESNVGGVKVNRKVDLKPEQLARQVRGALGLPNTSAVQANAEGTAHPSNGEPIVTTRVTARNGAKVPLNSPGINWRNAGGWSYKTTTGKYIPSGSSDQQKFIEENLGSGGYRLHTSTPATSNGQPYRTQSGNIVPGGSREGQLKMEERYAMERQRTFVGKCDSLFSEIPRPSIFSAVPRKGLFS